MTNTSQPAAGHRQKLEAQAAAKGQDVETFVREAVETKLAISGRSFREIMAPVHEEFDKSGMTEAELESFIDGEVAAAQPERRAYRGQQ